MVDIPNEIAKSGHIYFPEFCKLVLDRFRQVNTDSKTWSNNFNLSRKGGTEDDLFRQNMFKVLPSLKTHCSFSSNQNLLIQMMCGTDPFPKDFKAKKYRQAAVDIQRKKRMCDIASNEDQIFAG